MKNYSWKKKNSSILVLVSLFIFITSGFPSFAEEYQHLRFGDPSRAKPALKYHRLLKKEGYAVSYNSRKKTPNWVAWQLNKSWFGPAKRKNYFKKDKALDKKLKGPRSEDYTNSGYDRGHLCPSADRTKTQDLNDETFLMTNMIPQHADVNRGPWVKFESWCRGQVEKGKELYIYAGASGRIKNIGAHRVNVPMYCWKVVLIAPKEGAEPSDITEDTKVIAIDMHNVEGDKKGDWRSYVTSVDSIEQVTNLDFFKNVDPSVQNKIESRIYGEDLSL